MPDPTDAERWLTSVVNQADYLATQWHLAPAHEITKHAQSLTERLRELDNAANK